MTICDACFAEVARRLPITPQEFAKLPKTQREDVLRAYENRYMVCKDCHNLCLRRDAMRAECQPKYRKYTPYLREVR